jgi:hypothetical protein
MKRDKILYWIFTGLTSLGFLMSSMMYLTHNPELMKGFNSLGYPVYFVTILGVAKLTGALALLNPWLPKLREWAYAGFTFTLIGAAWTHIATHTRPTAPIVFLVLMGVSYFFYQRVSNPKMQLVVR